MKNKAIGITVSLILVLGFLVGSGACAKAPTTTASETLKIGIPQALNWPIGLDTMNALNLDVEKVNSAGGLKIGGKNYNIELIIDDTKMDMALAKTMAEKEIFQDQVKFILGDMWCDSYLPLTEENKIVMLAVPPTTEIYNPNYKYCFQGGVGNTNFPAVLAYCANKFPDKKTYVGVFPDRVDGRAYAAEFEKNAKNSGLQVIESIFYPGTATDLSAVGTKIKTLNPDLLAPYGGGPPGDAMVIKAAYSAGYRGQIIGASTIPGGVLMGIAGPEALEGFVSIGWPEEFEPAITATAREFKADYTAKYGEWNYPEIVTSNEWWILKAALQEAGSVDVEKVAAVLNNGLNYESICGSGQMISRPDIGVDRTVDTVLGDIPVKQIVGGQLEHIDTISLKQALAFCKQIWGVN